jgi:hypothetical protein
MWQGRYNSCPLDKPDFWAALRYTELNPVRAGMVVGPETDAWRSAAAHCEYDGARRIPLDATDAIIHSKS